MRELLTEMSFSRDDYQIRVRRFLRGALKEFYKARLAEKNGLMTWVAHWDREVARLLRDELPDHLLHDTSFRDKRVAVMEVVRGLQEKDGTFRRIATNEVLSDFRARRLKHRLSDADTRSYWKLAMQVVDDWT